MHGQKYPVGDMQPGEGAGPEHSESGVGGTDSETDPSNTLTVKEGHTIKVNTKKIRLILYGRGCGYDVHSTVVLWYV